MKAGLVSVPADLSHKRTVNKYILRFYSNVWLTSVDRISPSSTTGLKRIFNVLNRIVGFSALNVTFLIISSAILVKSVPTETKITVLQTSVRKTSVSALVNTVLFWGKMLNFISKCSRLHQAEVVIQRLIVLVTANHICKDDILNFWRIMEYLNRSYRVRSEILPVYMLNWLKGTLYLTDRYDETSWFNQCASAEQRNLPRFEYRKF